MGALSLWTTPLYQRTVDNTPDINDALRDLILDRTRTHASHTGVRNADKTGSDLLRIDHPAIARLRGWITDAADTLNNHAHAGLDPTGLPVPMLAEAWAVVYQPGGIHHIHAHHDSAWSGVYYVHTGHMAAGSGDIQFIDPRPGATAATPGRTPLHTVTPAPGLLLAWPSWLLHWVTPYQGESERISVAFNVGFRR